MVERGSRRIGLILTLGSIALGALAVGQLTAATGGATTRPDPVLTVDQERIVRAIQCGEKLREIFNAILTYAGDHDGKFPSDLRTLFVAEKMRLTTFVCPAAPSAVPENWRTMKAQEQADWVNAHTDYIYTGAGKNIISADANSPILYERDDDHGGSGMSILFGDGHVEFLTITEVHKRIGARAGTERATTRVAPAAGARPAIPLISIDEAKAILARKEINSLKVALNAFEADNGRFPTAGEGLQALTRKPAVDFPNWRQYIDRVPMDPWGHPFQYACPGAQADFDLSSCGPDGKAGTSDDLK